MEKNETGNEQVATEKTVPHPQIISGNDQTSNPKAGGQNIEYYSKAEDDPEFHYNTKG